MQQEQATFTLQCLSKGPHDATLAYCGQICKEGALALACKLEHLFGYYHYNKVVLRIESPGGQVDGLDYLLRQVSQYAKQGKWIETRTIFTCASAAAVLLAAGRFGARSVSSQTLLLFHSSRMQSAGLEWTATNSARLTKALLNIDRKIIDALLERFINACGGESGFSNVLLERLDFVNRHWSALAPQVVTIISSDSDMAAFKSIKALKRTLKLQSKSERVIATFKRYLVERFQTDQPMHVLEAFSLCLIDEVQDVIRGDQVRIDDACDRQVSSERGNVDRADEVIRAVALDLATTP
jgi:ATP-dependent protease ClpP protease subunit